MTLILSFICPLEFCFRTITTKLNQIKTAWNDIKLCLDSLLRGFHPLTIHVHRLPYYLRPVQHTQSIISVRSCHVYITRLTYDSNFFPFPEKVENSMQSFKHRRPPTQILSFELTALGKNIISDKDSSTFVYDTFVSFDTLFNIINMKQVTICRIIHFCGYLINFLYDSCKPIAFGHKYRGLHSTLHTLEQSWNRTFPVQEKTFMTSTVVLDDVPHPISLLHIPPFKTYSRSYIWSPPNFTFTALRRSILGLLQHLHAFLLATLWAYNAIMPNNSRSLSISKQLPSQQVVAKLSKQGNLILLRAV